MPKTIPDPKWLDSLRKSDDIKVMQWSHIKDAKLCVGYTPHGEQRTMLGPHRVIELTVEEKPGETYRFYICGEGYWSKADEDAGKDLGRLIERQACRNTGDFQKGLLNGRVNMGDFLYPLWDTSTDCFPGYEMQADRLGYEGYEGRIVRNAHTNNLIFIWDDREDD